MDALIPVDLKLLQKSRNLELSYADGSKFDLSCEYLRVFSPSAEVKGHGPGQEKLQAGKKNVNIIAIEPVGNYAVKFFFDDGHNSGIYTWQYLYELAKKQETNWQSYLSKLEAAGLSRER